MIMKLMTFLLFISLNVVIASDDYTPGEGRFWAQDHDSVSFIKDQLLYEATKDVITKELQIMGLSAEVFWQKYDAKLNTSIEKLNNALKEEYKIGTEEETKANLTKYKKELRHKTLLKRKDFGKLESVLLSYSIRKQSRSSKNAQSRFMKIEAKILKDRLSQIYYRFVRGRKSSDYGKLYVQVKYNLRNISFTDMGIANENDFIHELSSNWLDSLEKKRPNNIASIKILSKDLNERLDSISDLSPEETYRNIPDQFVNSLLMTVYVDIVKKSIDLEHSKADIAYEGGIQLKDLQTGRIVWNSSFSKGRQQFEFTSDKDIGQKVINYVYRMPLSDFNSMTYNIERFTPVSLVKKVNLFNYQSLNQVQSLLKLLEQVGIRYSLKTNVLTLTPTSSEVLFLLDAKETDLRTLLKSNEAAKKDLNYELIDSNGGIGIKFNHEPTANKNI